MARSNAKRETAERIVRGSTNVFADLGYADADERQTKLRLAYALNSIMDERRLSQAAPPSAKREGPARQRHDRAAATRLGVNQPKVSALRNYKLEGFSVERLMTFLNALDRDVEIVIRKKPRSRAAGRISVVAA
jgi:predicted XRE-type DNA-binding protein